MAFVLAVNERRLTQSTPTLSCFWSVAYTFGTRGNSKKVVEQKNIRIIRTTMVKSDQIIRCQMPAKLKQKMSKKVDLFAWLHTNVERFLHVVNETRIGRKRDSIEHHAPG